jgi:YbbR-like protein
VTPKGGIKEQIRGALFDNLSLKALSFVSALGLYAFLHGAENAQRTFSVSVVLVMPPATANRTLVSQIPNEVGVTLRGSRSQLDELHANDLGTVRLDLSGGRKTAVDLDASMFHVPTGLTVEQVIPASIDLRWDDVISRSLLVQAARTGEPSPGFTVKGAIMVEPPSVLARGPRSIVEVMQFARAAPFDVTGLTEGQYRRPLLLDRPPSLVTYDAESVAANITIGRELLKKEFFKLRVEVIGVPRATTMPATVKVTVTGTAEDVNGLAPDAVVPHVDPRTVNADTSKPGSDILPVVVDVGKATAEVDPPKVVVKW